MLLISSVSLLHSRFALLIYDSRFTIHSLVRTEHRNDRLAREASRLRLSLFRNLRRPGQRVGLWPNGHRTLQQRQAGVVALDGLRTRRHRRSGFVDHFESTGLEVLRT